MTRQTLFYCGQEDASLQSAFAQLGGFIRSDSSQAQLTSVGMTAGEPECIPAQELELAASMLRRFERAVAACLVADVSGSLRGEKLERAKLGMSAFLSHLVPERGDVVGLIAFSSTPRVVVPMGKLFECAEQVERAIAALRPGEDTALVDAVLLAWDEVSRWDDWVRAVIVVTDGLENASTRSKPEALQRPGAVLPRRTTVFGLAFGDDADYELLRQFSEVTGGVS